MSWMDFVVRPFFSLHLWAVQKGKDVRLIVNLVETYAQKADRASTNQALLDRNAITGAALKRVQKGWNFPYSDRDRLLELIAATPLYHRNALNILAREVRQREDWYSAGHLGDLALPDDSNRGIFEGKQDKLAMRYAELRYVLRRGGEQDVNDVLTHFARELDKRWGEEQVKRKRPLGGEQKEEIFKTIAFSNRFERLDSEVAFHLFCALRIPEATQQAAEMFFRSPEDLSGAVLGQIAMSDWKSGGAKPAILEEIANPERLKTEIHAGREQGLRRAFEEFGSREPKLLSSLSNIFEDCAADVMKDSKVKFSIPARQWQSKTPSP